MEAWHQTAGNNCCLQAKQSPCPNAFAVLAFHTSPIAARPSACLCAFAFSDPVNLTPALMHLHCGHLRLAFPASNHHDPQHTSTAMASHQPASKPRGHGWPAKRQHNERATSANAARNTSPNNLTASGFQVFSATSALGSAILLMTWLTSVFFSGLRAQCPK